MPHTEVLLITHMENLGSEGDIVKVRPGYARNYLIPRQKALPLNLANKKRLESLKIARAARETDDLQKAQEIAEKLSKISLAVAVKTGAGGKLFGSVTSVHILEKLEGKGFYFEKHHLSNFSPIKELGLKKVAVRIHREVETEFTVEVVSENPIEDNE
tara:strand:+ start:2479 stop:2952 length:474 start_codon:yes stop_codon:yes gene_type:complete